ncbi:MAG: tetratricopeptide repeat protein [Ruminiclostridium sp.]|nr:tetratricopeptide repeat protein [Ruminiclostridium sp.]
MNTRILSLITAGAMLLSSVAVSGCSQSSTVAGISDTLSIAERYLAELNYEQAIIEFDKVLNIDLNNVDAYLGKAEAYLALGNTEAAVSALRTGYDKTGDARIKSKLDELTAGEETSGTTMTEGPETAAEQETTGGTETTTETAAPEDSIVYLDDPDPAEVEDMLIAYINGEGELIPEMLGHVGSLSIYGTQNVKVSVNGKGSDKIALIPRRAYGDEEKAEHEGQYTFGHIDGEISWYDYGTISDLSFINYMPDISCLDIYCTNITDTKPLKKWNKKANVTLEDNYFKDMSLFKDIETPVYVKLSGNNVSDLSFLSGYTNLGNLYLYDEKMISDISPLSGLDNLLLLSLSCYNTLDLSPLSSIKSLKYLDFDVYPGGEGLDLTPLYEMKNLERIGFRYQTDLADVLQPSINDLYEHFPINTVNVTTYSGW